MNALPAVICSDNGGRTPADRGASASIAECDVARPVAIVRLTRRLDDRAREMQAIDHPTRDLKTRQPFGAGEMPAAAALTSWKRNDAPDRGGDVGRERWLTHLIGEPSRPHAVLRSGPDLAHNVIVGVDRHEQRQPNYCAAAAATPVGSRRSAVTVATPATACQCDDIPALGHALQQR